MKPIGEWIPQFEERLRPLGFDLVELAMAGSGSRPILRLRIDRPDSTIGDGVTVHDCARVSRALEEWLDGLEGMPERYVLEVSSPGVERPLWRDSDWPRFAGQEVALRVRGEPSGGRIRGVLLGSRGGEEDLQIGIRRGSGEEAWYSRALISEARLVYRWEEQGGRPGRQEGTPPRKARNGPRKGRNP